VLSTFVVLYSKCDENNQGEKKEYYFGQSNLIYFLY